MIKGSRFGARVTRWNDDEAEIVGQLEMCDRTGRFDIVRLAGNKDALATIVPFKLFERSDKSGRLSTLLV